MRSDRSVKYHFETIAKAMKSTSYRSSDPDVRIFGGEISDDEIKDFAYDQQKNDEISLADIDSFESLGRYKTAGEQGLNLEPRMPKRKLK